MAKVYWQGTDGNWGAAGNWSTGSVPTDDDFVVFPRTASGAITAGLDQSAVSLSGVHIASGSTIRIGAENDPLILVVNNDFQHAGAGDLHLDFGGGVGTVYLIADDPATHITLYDNGLGVASAMVLRGTLIARQGVTRLHVSEVNSPGDATVVIDGSVFGQLFQQSGRVFISTSTAGGVILMQGGYCEVTNDKPVLGAYLFGGVLEHNGAGTTTTLVVMGGLAEFNAVSKVRTITNATVYAGGRFHYDPDLVTVTNLTIIDDEIGNGPVP